MKMETAPFDERMAEETKRVHRPVDRFQGSRSIGPRRQMRDYRAYIIGPDSHVQNRVDLRCADDAEAIRLAKQLVVDGRDVELWQLDRKIEMFKHTSESRVSSPSG